MAAPCRRLVHAARWNGSAPHTATGAVERQRRHCQYGNCSTGTIAMATTGTASPTQTSSRVRSSAAPGPSAPSSVAARPAAGGSSAV